MVGRVVLGQGNGYRFQKDASKHWIETQSKALRNNFPRVQIEIAVYIVLNIPKFPI